MNMNPLPALISRVTTAFRAKAAGPSPGDATFWKSFTGLFGSKTGVTSPYAQSVWIYSATKKIATNIAGTPFKMYRNEQDGEKVEVKEGELVDLFAHPNEFTTGAELWEATQTYLDLLGNAFWIMERPHLAAIPENIYCVDPRRILPAFNAARTQLIGWVYEKGKDRVPFQLHEVLHFKYFNPDDPLMGIAPYKCVEQIVDQDYFANIYNSTFFKEGAAISGFIEADRGLTDNQYTRLLNQVNDRHQGMTKAHRIGLLENGARFKETKLSHKDMDFIKMKDLSKKEIYTAYGTNDVVQGFFQDVKSYEGMKTAMRAFWEGTLIPRTRYLKGGVNAKFLRFIGSGDIYGEFDLSEVAALKEDFTDKVKNAKELFGMGYPVNKINKRLDLGMEDISGGDVGWLPANLLPADGSGAPDPNAAADAANAKADAANQAAEAKTPAKMLTSLVAKQLEEEEDAILIEEGDVLIWENYLIKHTPIEELFKQKIRRFFMDARLWTLTGLNEYYRKAAPSQVLEGESSENARRAYAEGIVKGITDDIYDKGKETEELTDTLTPLYVIAEKVGAEMVADEIGVSFTWDPLDESFLKWQELRVTDIAPEMIETVEAGLRKTLTEGIIAGESVAELGERIKDIYNFAIERVNTIARTESASMLENGRFQMMLNNGVQSHKWFTAMDSEVRTTHRNLHGSVAPLGQKFKYVRGLNAGQASELRFPTDMNASADEVINCRCLTLPVVNSAGEEV